MNRLPTLELDKTTGSMTIYIFLFLFTLVLNLALVG